MLVSDVSLVAKLSVLNAHSVMVDLSCNAKKTVCMVFTPQSRSRIVSSEFPRFKSGETFIQFVYSFKYHGHYIASDLSGDNDILREICNMLYVLIV